MVPHRKTHDHALRRGAGSFFIPRQDPIPRSEIQKRFQPDSRLTPSPTTSFAANPIPPPLLLRHAIAGHCRARPGESAVSLISDISDVGSNEAGSDICDICDIGSNEIKSGVTILDPALLDPISVILDLLELLELNPTSLIFDITRLDPLSMILDSTRDPISLPPRTNPGDRTAGLFPSPHSSSLNLHRIEDHHLEAL